MTRIQPIPALSRRRATKHRTRRIGRRFRIALAILGTFVLIVVGLVALFLATVDDLGGAQPPDDLTVVRDNASVVTYSAE